MFLRLLFISSSLALFNVCLAEYGPCRYESDACSCKLGNEDQGVCWDRIPDDPLNCRPRSCKKGWTCACGGRTHLCKIAQMTSYHNTGGAVKISEVLASKTQSSAASQFSLRQVSSISRPCTSKAAPTASDRELILGTAKIGISPKGLLADKCTYLAWWHNGVLMGNYKPAGSMTSAKVDSEMKKRADHSLLELRGGDILSFRFKDTSYYCYTYLTQFTINGAAMDSTSAGFDTRFAREHTDNWFSPQFTPILADTEAKDNLKAFTPLRAKMLPKTEQSSVFGETIVPGKDYYQPPGSGDNYDQNHKLSNFYFRIQIPTKLPSSVRNLNGDDKIFMHLQ